MKRGEPVDGPARAVSFVRKHREAIATVAQALEEAGLKVADLVIFLGDPQAEGYQQQVRALYGSHIKKQHTRTILGRDHQPMCSYFPRSLLRDLFDAQALHEAASAMDHPAPAGSVWVYAVTATGASMVMTSIVPGKAIGEA